MTSYSFHCKDIGMNCGFSTEARSTDELMPKIVEHARNAHGMKEISADLKQKVTDAIKMKH